MSLFGMLPKEFGDYLFPSGELTEREREFLDREEFDKLVQCKTKDEFLRVLQETFYSSYVEEIKKSSAFEFVMDEESVRAISYLREHLMERHRNLIEFLILDRDLHNVKVVFKSLMLKKEMRNIFLRSSHTFDEIKNALETKDVSRLEGAVREMTQRIIEVSEETSDIRLIELKLEQFFFVKLQKYVSSTHSEPLMELMKRRIDMLNIKNVYRSKTAGEKFAYEEFLYDGGYLDAEFFRQFQSESVDFFAQSIERGEYTKMIMQGTHLLYSEETFASFEKNEEEYILRFFAEAAKTYASLERVIGFFIRKRFEARSLNIIYNGIANNIAREKIRHRIPQL